MEEIVRTRDLFFEDSGGSLVLRDQILKGRMLSNFDLAGELEMPLCIENCQLIDCSLDNETMALWRGVLLKNVIFQNLGFSGEAIIRPHMCSLENVKFIDQRRDFKDDYDGDLLVLQQNEAAVIQSHVENGTSDQFFREMLEAILSYMQSKPDVETFQFFGEF